MRQNAVYYKYTVSSPRQLAVILFVLQFNSLAARTHQSLGQLFVLYRECKVVGLDLTLSRRYNTLHNELALIGLENIALEYYKVERATFYTFAKNGIVFPIDIPATAQYDE